MSYLREACGDCGDNPLRDLRCRLPKGHEGAHVCTLNDTTNWWMGHAAGALTKNQLVVLRRIAKECCVSACTGFCADGWFEPLSGGALRSAQSLQRKGLVVLANGRNRGIAAHVTYAGREVVRQ